MDPGERTTGTRDEHYDLVAVLYHALHGAETIETYVLDAEAAGDERLAAFFREAQATHRQLAERAKGLLGILEVPPEPEVTPDIPPEGGLPPGATPGDVPPRSADIQREPDVRADEVSVPVEEAPPTAGVPRTPQGATLPPDEGAAAEPGGGVQRETSPGRPPRGAPPTGLEEDEEAGDVPPGSVPDVPPPGEAPGEPNRTSEQQTAGQTDERQKMR